MKKTFAFFRKVLNNPWVNLGISVALLYIGIKEIYNNLDKISIHHVLTLYAFFMLADALYTIIQALVGVKDARDNLNK